MSIFAFLLGLSLSHAVELCGKEAETITTPETESYSLAILGNTRPADLKSDPLAGRIGPTKGVTSNLLGNIAKNESDCVVFVGDMVKNGSKKEWKRFEKQQLSLIPNQKVQPVIGDYEAIKDPKYLNTESLFPDLGTDIGYNRVGSWSYFDVETEGVKWRLLVLDANKEALTSRWNEQMLWLDEVTKGDFEAMFIFIHLPWYNLAGASPDMNPNGEPEELISYVEGSVDMLKLRGVFFGGGHANQVILPNGPYGTLHVGAGGGGAPAEDLYQWQDGMEHGMGQKVELESKYVSILREQVDRLHGQSSLSPTTLDKAFNTGTYKGFPGLFEGTQVPTQGWWELILQGKKSAIVYHHHFPNGTVEPLYELRYTEKRGWKGYKR